MLSSFSIRQATKPRFSEQVTCSEMEFVKEIAAIHPVFMETTICVAGLGYANGRTLGKSCLPSSLLAPP